jgi:hypothetical protein
MKSNLKFINPKFGSWSFIFINNKFRTFNIKNSFTFGKLLCINDLILIYFLLVTTQSMLANANQSNTLIRHKNADQKLSLQQQQPLSTLIATTTNTLTVENSDYFQENSAGSFKYLQRPQVSTNITAKVGETITLYCAINSSYGLNPGVSIAFFGFGFICYV